MTRLKPSPTLLVLGPGYTAQPLMQQMKDAGWHVIATHRSPEGEAKLKGQGFTPVSFEAGTLDNLQSTLHVLISIPPKEDGDPSLQGWEAFLRATPHLGSICYLSSTNVYGDHKGNWVDEETPPAPSLKRGQYRLKAEQAWQKLAADIGARLFIFRLAGIYGPGRNAIASLKSGKARCIIKPGQSFGRIHRTDITAAPHRAITRQQESGIF